MMAAKKGLRSYASEEEKNFIAEFRGLCRNRRAWEAWTDFVSVSACLLSAISDMRRDVASERWKSYMDAAGKYSREERRTMTRMQEIMGIALEKNPDQDFLGSVHMGLDFGSDEHGQFFTPWDIAKFTAAVSIQADTKDKVRKKGFTTVFDEACGAGCMLLASRSRLAELSIDCRRGAFFAGQDVDPVAVKMCYFQLSLLGCAGYVLEGNSISEPPGGTELEPEYPPEKLWFTPPYFSDYWIRVRIMRAPGGPTARALMKEMEKLKNGTAK